MRLIVLLSFFLFLFSNSYSQDQAKKQSAAIDELITTHIGSSAKVEFDQRMSFMEIVIDDIARLCELKQEQKQQLILAAKGAATRSMERWHEQAVHHFKTRIGDADIDTARQILANMGNLSIGRANADRLGESEELWEESITNILTQEQVSKYRLICSRRDQAKIDAFASMSLALLDNYLRLTPKQKEQLTPIVQHSANLYLEEIQSYWGLEKNMLMSLVNSADKDTLTSILSDNQFTRLRAVTSNLDHFWDQRRRDKKK